MGFLSSSLIFENNNKHPDNLIVIPKRNYPNSPILTVLPYHQNTSSSLFTFPRHRRVAVQIAICSSTWNTSALETRCSRSIPVGGSIGIARSYLRADASCWA
ncbi:hypothetical protein AHAS_Ahas15G0268100 [Arachis hypogaea]